MGIDHSMGLAYGFTIPRDALEALLPDHLDDAPDRDAHHELLGWVELGAGDAYSGYQPDEALFGVMITSGELPGLVELDEVDQALLSKAFGPDAVELQAQFLTNLDNRVARLLQEAHSTEEDGEQLFKDALTALATLLRSEAGKQPWRLYLCGSVS